MEGLERQLGDERRRVIQLQGEKCNLQADLISLNRQMNEMRRELSSLRQLKADVLTQAIHHGYDGKPRK